MSLVYNVPFVSIFLSILIAVLCTLFKNGRNAQRLTFALWIGVAVGSAMLLSTLMFNGGTSFTYAAGHYPAPWGNELRAGPLEALFALVYSIVMLLSLSGGAEHTFEDVVEEKVSLYYTVMNLLFAGMLALIYTNDIFTSYVFIEISTIAACSIIMAKGEGESLLESMRYLIMYLIGSTMFLFGVVILYSITGHLLMEFLQKEIVALWMSGEYQLPLAASLALMLIGLCIKTAIFPFHSILPGAHGSATTASSAVLSGLLLESYVILIIKIFYRVFTPEIIASYHVYDIMFAFGIIAMLLGSYYALKEDDIKRMLAYSSAAQMGYIFVAIGIGTNAGAVAACLHIITHAFTKAMLFTTSGALIGVSGHSRDFYDLRGAAHRDRLAGIGFTIGAISMIGVPLLACFVSKLYIAIASLIYPPQAILTLFALGLSMVLNALYFVPAVIAIWTPKRLNTVHHHSGNAGHVAVGPKEAEPVEEYAEEERDPALHLLFKISTVAFIVLNFAVGCGFLPIVNVLQLGLMLL
ncbi:MAG: sodium:proton antiporter [Firmicutes bacterium]|nr:sodium:proton antiporter [Bacillota bacterium]MBR7113942.1 sodium:proton antiporter [Bacillota bacterium]